MVVHDVSRRVQPRLDVQNRWRATLSAVAERVGKAPLPVLVRDVAEVVERHCIETALRIAEGNRTAAAEMLGISRQSLYSKLDRYRIDVAGSTGRTDDRPGGQGEAAG